MTLKELTVEEVKRLKGDCLLVQQLGRAARPALTAEQIIKRDGLAALNIRKMVELADVSINTLKRWAQRDPEQFSELVAQTNGQLADLHAENAVGVLLGQLGTGYGVRQEVTDGVMKLGVYRVDAPSLVFVVTCSYDAPDRYLVAKAQQAKENLAHV